MNRSLLTVALGAGLALAACGSDSTDGSPSDTSPSVTTTVTPPTDAPTDLPADLTSADVCALVDAATIESALDATEVEAVPGDFSTPQCSYNYQAADGTFTNLVTAVQRAVDDLGGRVGDDAFDYAVELNQTYAGTAEFLPLEGIGDQAAFAKDQLGLLIVQVGPRVVTVMGSSLDQPAAEAVGGALATAVAALD